MQDFSCRQVFFCIYFMYCTQLPFKMVKVWVFFEGVYDQQIICSFPHG